MRRCFNQSISAGSELDIIKHLISQFSICKQSPNVKQLCLLKETGIYVGGGKPFQPPVPLSLAHVRRAFPTLAYIRRRKVAVPQWRRVRRVRRVRSEEVLGRWWQHVRQSCSIRATIILRRTNQLSATITVSYWLLMLVTPPFERFLCLFVYLFIYLFIYLSATLRENCWTDLHEIFREGVEWPWDDLVQFWVNSGKRVGGSKVKLFVIIGHSSESVAFARWQQRTGVNKSVA